MLRSKRLFESYTALHLPSSLTVLKVVFAGLHIGGGNDYCYIVVDRIFSVTHFQRSSRNGISCFHAYFHVLHLLGHHTGMKFTTLRIIHFLLQKFSIFLHCSLLNTWCVSLLYYWCFQWLNNSCKLWSITHSTFQGQQEVQSSLLDLAHLIVRFVQVVLENASGASRFHELEGPLSDRENQMEDQ